MKPVDHQLTFSGAGSQELQAPGKFVRVLEAPVDAVYLKIDNYSELKRVAGQGVNDPDGFKKIVVRSAVAQTVLLTVSDTEQPDTNQNVTVSGTVAEASSTTIAKQPVVTVPAGGGIEIIAGNVNRNAVRIGIASDQPGGVWLGESGVAANQGGFLEPGQIDYMPTAAAVYAFNSGASDVVVNVLELSTP